MTDKGIKPVALITGGSRGIGLASARLFAKQGYNLVLAATSEQNLRHAVSELKIFSPETDILIQPTQVEDPQQVKQLYQETQQKFKRLDVLVNAAGIMQDMPFAMTSSQALHQLFGTNVYGSFYCSQYASRLMSRQKKGAIIHLASVVGEQGSAGQAAYAASKSALDGLTRSLAKELAPSGIRVHAVAPGFINTDMTAHYSEAQRQDVMQKITLQREGSPNDVAELIAFLASDRASYITGQVINVNGGMLL